MKVTLEDAIALGYCRRGCRAFAEVHNLDWDAFRKEGLDSDAFANIDDEMCRAFLTQAADRENRKNGR